jgi:hypothetical protein
MDPTKIDPIKTVQSFTDYVQNMNEKTLIIYMTGITFIVILIYLFYKFIYLRNLQSRECSIIDGFYPKINGNMRALNKGDPQCEYTFKDYYIKTAYNACSGGSFTNDYVSTCVLKSILKQGVRAFDFEVFSIDDKPVIATSDSDSYYYKQTFNYIDFKDIMDLFRDYAFRFSDAPNASDPIIIHLRFKSANQKMYQKLATLLENYDNLLLGKDYSYENNKQNFGNTSILDILGKVVIIVDMKNPEFLQCEKFYEYVNMTSNSLYMRGLIWYDVQYSPDMDELTTYNKQCMTIAMPDGGTSPPNISSLFSRTCGVQMIAMQYQKFDTLLEENELFFDTVGYAFALKPEKLRYIPIIIEIPDAPPDKISYAPREISAAYYEFSI